MSFFTLSYILLWLLVAFESIVLVLVLRELGVIYLGRRDAFERDGPDIGKPLPALQAYANGGTPRTLADLPGDVRALLFGGVGCRLCGPAMEKFERWSDRVPGLAAVMLMERSDDSTMPTAAGTRNGQEHETWWIQQGEMFRAFGVRVSPYAVLVDAQGDVVSKGLVNHHSDIKRLIKEARDARQRNRVVAASA